MKEENDLKDLIVTETIILSDEAFDEFELLLTGLGTFCTKDCVSSEDLCKLLNKTKEKQIDD